jgi:hypothetical protein
MGIALGPYALGAVEESTLRACEPVGIVGTAWFTLMIGAHYGVRDREGGRISARGIVCGAVLSLLTAALASAAVALVAVRVTSLAGRDLWLVAGGSGLVAAETTRHAVRWALGDNEFGPLSRLAADVADADDVVPLLGAALFFPLMDPPPVAQALPFWVWGGATLAIGVVLGATSAALLRSELRASDGWGVIIGAVLLTTGIAWRLGLSPQAATFALGASLSLFSRHGTELRHMIGRSEHAVLLPTLLLAGADVQVHRWSAVLVTVVVVFAARAAIRFLAAPVLTGLAGAPSGAAVPLGAGLLTSGALSITLGLSMATRFPGLAGDTILAVSVGLAVLGEVVGPRALRRALVRAGELDEAPVSSDPVSSGEAAPAAEPQP